MLKTTAALRRTLDDADDVRTCRHGTGRGAEQYNRKKNKMATGADHGLKRIVWKSKFPSDGRVFILHVKQVALYFYNLKGC